MTHTCKRVRRWRDKPGLQRKRLRDSGGKLHQFDLLNCEYYSYYSVPIFQQNDALSSVKQSKMGDGTW